VDWDPDFLERSPMLAPLREHAEPLSGLRDWPDAGILQDLVSTRNLTNANGSPLRLVAPSGEPYETGIYLRGELQVRGRNWHDLFNVLAWLAYPLTKRELNRRHYLAWQKEKTQVSSARRGRMRDALTLFDESGAIVASSDRALLDDLRNFRWKRLFWERRERLAASVRFFVLGHALFEKALEPYVGMTAHALLIELDRDGLESPRVVDAADALVSASLRDSHALDEPRALAPLPLLGVPGWWHANARAEFYDDIAYFRPGRAGAGRTE
jgi:hypothetical protein